MGKPAGVFRTVKEKRFDRGFERIALSWPRALGIALLAAGAALTLKR